MSSSAAKGTALITGASRGIGAVYADRLAKRGCDLILVARNEERLEALSARIKSETGRSVTPLRADLNDKADLAKVETTLRDNQSITLLVNNAGIGSIAPLMNADVEKMDAMISLNITALTRLTYAAAPAFVAAWRRHDHQHWIGGWHLAREAQRCVRRDQILCPCVQPFAAARARG